MNKAIDQYGGMKMSEKTGKMHKIGTPQHVKAVKEALKNGWVPSEMFQYGVVQYYMTRGGIPKLVNLTMQGEIDYGWYVSHQIDPLLWRLGVIEEVTKYKKEKIQPPDQTTFG